MRRSDSLGQGHQFPLLATHLTLLSYSSPLWMMGRFTKQQTYNALSYLEENREYCCEIVSEDKDLIYIRNNGMI